MPIRPIRPPSTAAITRALALALLMSLTPAQANSAQANSAQANGRRDNGSNDRLADVEELMRRGGCLLCHRPSRPWIGPSFKEIADRHQGVSEQDRQAMMHRLRIGSVGNHTPIPMGPCDVSRLSDSELRHIIDHLLQPGGPKPETSSR